MKSLFKCLAIAMCITMALTISACNGTSDSTESTSDTTTTMEMESHADSMQQHAMAELAGIFPDTTVNGSAHFDAQAGGKVKMQLDITIPSKANKSVAVHIHENGDCGDMGKAAGGHWNPTNASHGKWGSGSFHSGDIGNVSLDASGKGTMELETDLWSLGGDAKTNILNKTIIVHGGVDDYTSQPSGNAGTRIGCGIIK